MSSPYWPHRTPENRRRAYPKYKGDGTADVVVIGAGLTGCTSAYTLAAAGLNVIVLEADRLAGGETGGGLGMIVPEPDAVFRAVEEARGRKVAKLAWQEAQRAAVDFAATLKKLDISCDLKPTATHLNAFTFADGDPLKRELAARKAAALDGAWVPPVSAKRTLSTESFGAMRLRGGATYDAVRAALGFASIAEKKGAKFYEHSRVKKTTFTRKDATVFLEGGAKIKTHGIVVATGEPGDVFGQLRRHVRVHEGHVVVTQKLNAEMRRETGARDYALIERGESSSESQRDNSRWLRFLADDRVLFGGVETKPLADRQRDKVLVQRAGQLMYELSVHYPSISGLKAEWAWPLPVVSTLDGLPWVGAHRNYPFHFFALALGWHGDAISWFTARSAARHFAGAARPEDDAFSFLRAL